MSTSGMADEEDSKSFGGDTVWVQVPQPALLGRGRSVCLLFEKAGALSIFTCLRSPF